MNVSWQTLASNCGSAITGRRLQWKEATDSWDTAADVSKVAEAMTWYTNTEVTGGVEYAVRFIATNDLGDGPAAAEATGTPMRIASRQTTEPGNSAPAGLPNISRMAQ